MSISLTDEPSVPSFFRKTSAVISAPAGAADDLSDNIKVVGRFAHTRRKFGEAVKRLPEKSRIDSSAAVGKRFCDKLFSLERDFAGLTFEERFKKRRELSKPVFDEFYERLGITIRLLKHGFTQRLFTPGISANIRNAALEDGRLEISGNRAERGVKPFVAGRKNRLFANAPRGAKASAILFSIIEFVQYNRNRKGKRFESL